MAIRTKSLRFARSRASFERSESQSDQEGLLVANLNEVHQYNDDVDQWAARREFELRAQGYDRARRGVLGVLRAIVGLDRFECHDPESAWIEMQREESR